MSLILPQNQEKPVFDNPNIDIYKTEHEKMVIAILVTLQHMIKDREAASSGSSSSD